VVVERFEVNRKLTTRVSILSALILLILVIFTEPAEAADRRPIDVVEIIWSGASRPNVTSGEVANSINTDVAKRWENLTHLVGAVEDRKISFYADKVLSQAITLNSPLACNRSDFSSFLNSIRTEAYKRLAVENFNNRYLIILMPRANCIWEGRSLIGTSDSRSGTMILQDTADPFIIAHELGHSLGLGHSNFLRCDSGQRDGSWRSCKAVEYGGTVDLMGNVPTNAPLSTYHQWRMGVIRSDQVKELWSTQSISLSSADMAQGFKAIFIRDGSSTYWVEYRRERLESGYTAGLVVYRTDPPPASAVVSPNIEDSYGSESNLGVSSDMWLVNLDNFNYSNSRSSGSMTLTWGKSFTVFSGNVTIEVNSIASNQDSATVTIRRAADLNAPPKPSLAIFGSIKSGDESVLQSGFEDRETFVNSFEIKRNEEVTSSLGRSDPLWRQTYLQPFRANRLLTVADLPEGKYSLSVRTIDLAGNKSEWSSPQNVNIDRGSPTLDSKIRIESLSVRGVGVRLNGVRDEGSQLCDTSIYNAFDYVSQNSIEKFAPNFEFVLNEKFVGRIQARDCVGNIRDAKIELSNELIAPSKGTRTGVWKNRVDENGNAQLQCVSKCSISMSVSGNIGIIAQSKASEVFLSGKKVAQISPSKSVEIINLEVGDKKRFLRISSRDILLTGVIRNTTNISDLLEITSTTQGVDPTLTLPSQASLINLGFKQEDFVNGWRVLPMAGGIETRDPTLDLCGADYDSEKLRIFRRQVAVTRSGSPYALMSSESVQYRDKKATAQAFLELQEKLRQCKSTGGFKDATGVTTKYQFKETSTQEKQLDIAESVIVHSIMGEGSNSRTLFAVYQFKGEYFTGLYVVKNGEKFFSEAELDHWTRVSQTFSSRLMRK
jgi:hypothetical protein